MNKILKFGCAPILVLGVLIMGPTSEVMSKHDESDFAQLKPVTVSSDKVDSSQEGKLIFVTGPLTAPPIHDPELDLTTPGMRLRRSVDIWQWKQIEHDITRVNPNTHRSEHVRYEYSYSESWCEKPVDSSRFIRKEGHQNPPATLPELDNPIPSELRIGAYLLAPELINSMGGTVNWHPPTGTPARKGTWDAAKGEFFLNLPADGKPVPGTIRYTYEVTDLPKEASALGQLKGNQLTDFSTPHGPKKPELKSGTYDAREFLSADISSAGVTRWFFRICNLLALLAAAFFFGLRGARLAGFVAAALLLCHLLPALFAR